MKTLKTVAAICLPVAKMAALILFLAGFRTQAASITWTNTASGGWDTAANWDSNSVPGASDTAIITNTGVTVSLNSSTSVGGIILGDSGTGTAALSLAGKTLGLNGPLTIYSSGSFTVDSGELNGITNAVLSGSMGWTAGYFGWDFDHLRQRRAHRGRQRLGQ